MRLNKNMKIVSEERTEEEQRLNPRTCQSLDCGKSGEMSRRYWERAAGEVGGESVVF